MSGEKVKITKKRESFLMAKYLNTEIFLGESLEDFWIIERNGRVCDEVVEFEYSFYKLLSLNLI